MFKVTPGDPVNTTLIRRLSEVQEAIRYSSVIAGDNPPGPHTDDLTRLVTERAALIAQLTDTCNPTPAAISERRAAAVTGDGPYRL